MFSERLNGKCQIRKETPADVEEITNITIAAFKTFPVSNQTEQFIINALRADNSLTISLVAEFNQQIVGHTVRWMI